MKIYNKIFLLYFVLSAYTHSSEPVFDSIFPHQYFLGTYLGIPYTKTPGIFSRDSLFNDINHLNVYSWVNPTYNLSTSKQSNLPMGFSYLPNHVQLNEAVLGIEKQVDSIQQESVDFGFNVTGEFGTDYRYGLMKGVFSQQYINQNLVYGFNPILFNAQVFIPGIGKGSFVTVGRYYAPGDIEFPLSNLNYLVSHSLTFTYSAFTQMGINVDTQFDENWSLFLGIHSASDNAPWSNSGQPSLVFFIQWTASDKKDSIWFGSNAINNGQYNNGWNNLQQVNLIWSHRFSDDLFIEMSSYYEYQFNALVDGNCTQGPVHSFSTYSSCNYNIPGLSNSFSLLGYLEKKWSDNDFSSLRAEFFNDFQGQRTGFTTPYLEFTLGLTHVFGNVLKLRPEVRYDTAMNATPYDNGNKKSLVIGLVDFILLL